MRTLTCAIALVLATAAPSLAQDRDPVPDLVGVAPRADDVRRSTRVVRDRSFWVVAGALNAAMVMDTKSTFDVLSRCSDCYERNPLVAPFVKRGPATTFVAGQIFDAGVMTMAAKMKGSDRKWMRRTWWVVPVALIAGHTIAYRNNINLVK